MTKPEDDEPFYIGYLPGAPEALGRFIRRAVIGAMTALLALAVAAAVGLPYFGAGRFEYGQAHRVDGTVRCEGATPRLMTSEADYLLVAPGKQGVPAELCGGGGSRVTLEGLLIERDGRRLLEIAPGLVRRDADASAPGAPVTPLGRFTLRGEIVDAKCYFGVMNPGEGRVHRACAELCLRGGIPAVLVLRDRAGGMSHLLIAAGDGQPVNPALLRWVGAPVEITGDVARQGRWLVLRPEWTSLRAVGQER